MVAQTLNVWMNGLLVGQWMHTSQSNQVFQYAPDWPSNPAGRPISLSMPFNAANAPYRGSVVENYFENLLPDNENILKRLRIRFKTSSTNAFQLLTAIGRDCVGAVQLLPPDTEPGGWDRIDSQPMTEADVATALRAAMGGNPTGQHETAPDQEFRISLAGAQEKSALLRFGGQWHRPLGATPTTHILKPPIDLAHAIHPFPDSVENEWLCSKIMASLGFEVAHSEMAQFEDIKVLVVERFDRRWQDLGGADPNHKGFVPNAAMWISRLPQEDFCQVAGLSPLNKYESEGGPGMANCLAYLNGSVNTAKDRGTFVLAQLAFWMLAATDGHAKNFSIALLRNNTYQLTPLYDVLSDWPRVGNGAKRRPIQEVKMAMAIHSKTMYYRMLDFRARHWKHLADTCGVDQIWEEMISLAQRLPAALEHVQNQLPPDFPQRIWKSISDGALKHAAQFLRELDIMVATGVHK